MQPRKPSFTLLLLFILPILACSINNVQISTGPDLQLTVTAQAAAIQQTAAAAAAHQGSDQNTAPPAATQVPPTAKVIAVTATPGAAAASATPAAQGSQVINSTLCWVGPGDKYEVVSSLSKGQSLDVIGRGNTQGWIIVRNPIYKDPCWVQSFDLQVDPAIDVNSLQVYYPPVPPTKTPVPPTPTP